MSFDRLGIVAYETPFAPCGGVAAVMKYLPEAMAEQLGQRVSVFTPLHHQVPQVRSLPETELVAVFTVPLGPRAVTINLRRLRTDQVDWYFVASDQRDLFAGQPDPYGVGGQLTRDALLFGAAVARAVWMLAPGQRWALHLIDWQASTVALALARGGSVAPHTLQLALHNSYDAGLRYYDLNQVGISPNDCPPAGSQDISTVLMRVLPLVSPKVCTVSRQFALDLLREPLHANILAEHLQPHLAGRLVGVDDGRFAAPSIPPELLAAKPDAAASRLMTWKKARWQQAVAALSALSDAPSQPVWGDRREFARLAADGTLAPLLMGGRDDPQQKGYDLFAEAIDRLLAGGCPAQFVLLPMPGVEGQASLGYLHDLAARWPGRVLALPFRFGGYLDLLSGAAYGVMPSLYEPFGSANEFYLSGTAGIARATGGLAQQIVPAPLGEALPEPVASLAATWHPGLGSARGPKPTGYLFRESFGSAEDWWRLRTSRYHTGTDDSREHQPLFGAMAQALVETVNAAVELWSSAPRRYGAMVLRGAKLILDDYTWERTAREYLEALDG